MCAKKAAASAPKKPAPKIKRKTAAAEANGELPVPKSALTTSVTSKKTVPAPSAKAKASTSPARERSFSNHDIGAVAGEIWALLAAKDVQTLATIKKDVAAPTDVVVAAIGWLAREDKLQLAASGKTLKISLKP